MKKFTRGMKTVDYIQTATPAEIAAIPKEIIKLDKDLLNEYETKLIEVMNQYEKLKMGAYEKLKMGASQHYFTLQNRYKIVDVICNVLHIKRKPKKIKLSTRKKQLLRKEFEESVIPSLTSVEDKIKYTLAFEKWLNK